MYPPHYPGGQAWMRSAAAVAAAAAANGGSAAAPPAPAPSQQPQFPAGLPGYPAGMMHLQQQHQQMQQQHQQQQLAAALAMQQQQRQQQHQQRHQQHHSHAMAPPPAPPTSSSSSSFGAGGSMMPPPARGRTTADRDQERKQAAMARKQETQERQRRERELSAGAPQGGFNLFDRPERVSQGDNSYVNSVLGDYRNAQNIITGQSSCIGIEYQPPTPAPAHHHHIIGDDDDDEADTAAAGNAASSGVPGGAAGHHHRQRAGSGSGAAAVVAAANNKMAQQQQQLQQQHQARRDLDPSKRPPPTIPRPPGHQRLPDNLNETHRPGKHHRAMPTHGLAPPTSGATSYQQHQQQLVNHHNQQLKLQQQQQQRRQDQHRMHQQMAQHRPQQTPPSSSAATPSATSNGVPSTSPGSQRLKNIGHGMPKLSLDDDDAKLQQMLREMKNPFDNVFTPSSSSSSASSLMPPPLTAIITPHISEHEGNRRQQPPKYFGFPSVPPVALSPDRENPASSSSMAGLPPAPLIVPPAITPMPMTPVHPPPAVAASTAARNREEIAMPKMAPEPKPAPIKSGPCLSEDSDSDTNSGHDTQRQQHIAKPTPPQTQPQSRQQQQPPPSQGLSPRLALPTQSRPPPASSPKQAHHKSSSESSSDSSSSEEEEESNKSSSDEKDLGAGGNKQDEKQEFSLTNLLGKVKSTHSPGPNMHPSPKLNQDTATPKLSPDEERDIAGLLSNTPQPIQDLVEFDDVVGKSVDVNSGANDDLDLAGVTNSLVGNIIAPLSPIEPSPAAASIKSDLEDEQEAQEDFKRFSSPTKRSGGKVRPQVRAVPQQRELGDSSDEDFEPLPPASRRPPKKTKGREVRQPAASAAAKSRDRHSSAASSSSSQSRRGRKAAAARQPPPLSPPKPHPSPRQLAARKKKEAAAHKSKQVLSSPSSSSAEEEDSDYEKSAPTPPTPHFGRNKRQAALLASRRAPPPPPQRVDKEAKVVITKLEDSQASSAPPPAPLNSSGDQENNGKNKNLVMSRIFSSRAKTVSSGGKGKGGAKGGAKVEAVARVADATPAERDQQQQAGPTVRRRSDSRPIMLCSIPLRLMPRGFNVQINLFNHRRRRPRRPSGESISSTASSSSSRKRRRQRKESASSNGGPETNESDNKRLKVEENDGVYYGSDPRATNPAYDASSAQGSDLMPPPNKHLEYGSSKMARDDDDESGNGVGEGGYSCEGEEPSNYMQEAQRLKHEADKEIDRERQAMKYLQAVLYFSLNANFHEQNQNKSSAFTIYKETLNLIKHVCRPFRNADFGNFDNKLAVLSLRCQSLLYLKLYKMRRHELLECQKIIGDHIQKANSSQHSNSASSPQQNGVSPTPSPAGSEGSVCSKSSGYTSAGEGGRSSNGGVNTPPLTLGSSSSSSAAVAGGGGGGGGSLLSVPHAVMQKQHQYCSYLSQCHELWEMADVYASRGRCEEFLKQLDHLCGFALTLHSSMKELVKYTQKGLDFLSKEKENSSSSSSSSMLHHHYNYHQHHHRV